jgi:tRNA(His) 5'-end guanylyltransferase
MKDTSFGDRMKLFEGIEADRMLIPLLPVMARLDGRAFHTFCRGLRKPYDPRMTRLMAATTRFLVEETNALVGYCQSDEISLMWHTSDMKSQILFNGRTQKLVSILASLATAKFNQLLPEHLPERAGHLPLFDCRVWNVPTKVEAANTFLWRENDATRNSILAAGQAHFSHRELQGKDTSEVQEMLWSQKQVNWNDYPASFRRGIFVQRRMSRRKFTCEEIENLPQKHEARANPDLMVERWSHVEMDMPPFGQVVNRVAVLFDGAVPEVASVPNPSDLPAVPENSPETSGACTTG